MSEITNYVQATSDNAATQGASHEIEFEGNPAAKLLVTKEALTPRQPVYVGDVIQYIIKVQNTGTKAATNVVVTDNAPVHVSFTGATTDTGTITTSTTSLVVATVGPLAATQTATITITATIV